MNIISKEVNTTNNQQKLDISQENNNSKDLYIKPFDKKQRKILNFKLGINTFLSLLLIVLFFIIPHTYSDKWKVFFFMTIWSFAMNSFYIVSVTVIDWIRFIKNNEMLCLKYNHCIRNKYIRICFPFSISIVFLYWMLILLGDEFEYRGRDVSDTAVGLFFHGIILLFLLFDIFTSKHKNIKNYFYDILILNIVIAVYFGLLAIGKYIIDYDPYDFMERASVRQIIGSCILIYIAIFDGYVVINLIGNKLFENDISDKKMNNYYTEIETTQGNTIEKYDLSDIGRKLSLYNNNSFNVKNNADDSNNVLGTIN